MINNIKLIQPPPKKCVPFGEPELRTLINAIVWEPKARGQNPSPTEFRALLRIVTYFFTWSR